MEDRKLAYELGESVRLFVKNMGLLEKSELSCCGVSFSQYNAILEIGNAGEVNLNDLADLLNLDKSTLSKTVNNLVGCGWVTRETDAKDRRYITIALTDQGAKVYEGVKEALEAYYIKIYEAIPEEKREQVVESVELLLDILNKGKCCES
jgi:DNA-binding MarR family transcriptional regulator